MNFRKSITLTLMLSSAISAYGDNGFPAKDKCIVFDFNLVNNNISYTETVYRILWLEYRNSQKDISGLWEPENDIRNWIVDSLKKQGYKNVSTVDNYVNDEEFKKYIDLKKDDLKNNWPSDIVNTKNRSSVESYLKSPNRWNSFALVNSLTHDKCDYYVDAYSSGLYGNAPGYGMVISGFDAFFRVVDLKSGDAVAYDPIGVQDIAQKGGNLKAIEENEMALAKSGISSAIEKIRFDRLHPMSK